MLHILDPFSLKKRDITVPQSEKDELTLLRAVLRDVSIL